MTPMAETIDKIADDRLIHVIRHPNDYPWDFLAMKIILTRLNLKLFMNESDNTAILSECCDELRTLLKKSFNIPRALNDLNKILSLSVT